uniref:Uncharacterized protein n=1 Tax=Solanum lycopersicum TaxID=4081 RepID=A0A3Q7FJ79_SOLLC
MAIELGLRIGESCVKETAKIIVILFARYVVLVRLAKGLVDLPLQTSPKELLIMHDPSLSQGGQMNSFTFAGNQYLMQNGNAETFICESNVKLEDEVKEIGLQIKQHEDNIKFLQAALAKTYSASGAGYENKESSNGQHELETIE